jgi:FkbM family methyltransferase
MKEALIKSLVKLLPASIVRRVETPLRNKLSELNQAYGQNGEDIIVRRLLQHKRKGFFVDIGAHHPVRYSNTYSLYLKGWRGINVDAMPGSMTAFKERRPEDINLEVGVSDKEETTPFYIFNEPALNTFSKEEADKKNGTNGYELVKTVLIPTLPLGILLDRYVKEGTTIDYLNIDIEGLDMQALQSNNWNKYSPSVITVEYGFKGEAVNESTVYVFLKGKGYKLVSLLMNTLVFVKNDMNTGSAMSL